MIKDVIIHYMKKPNTTKIGLKGRSNPGGELAFDPVVPTQYDTRVAGVEVLRDANGERVYVVVVEPLPSVKWS